MMLCTNTGGAEPKCKTRAKKTLKVSLDTRPAANVDTQALVSYVFQAEKDQEIVAGVLADLDRTAGGAFSKLASSGELTGKRGEMTLLHFAPGLAAQRVLLIGAGKREKFTTAELRLMAASAVRYFKSRAVKSIGFLAREGNRDAASAQAVTEGLILGSFEGDKYRTEARTEHASKQSADKNGPVESAVLVGFDAGAQAAIDRGTIIAESQNFARELGNEPSNVLTPVVLAERAEALAREAGLAIEILDEKRMAELKMGAILAVGRGSVEPPRMMVLTYTPPGSSASDKNSSRP